MRVTSARSRSPASDVWPSVDKRTARARADEHRLDAQTTLTRSSSDRGGGGCSGGGSGDGSGGGGGRLQRHMLAAQ